MAPDVKGVCIFVLLMVTLHQIIAKDCSDIESIRDCDQCSACNGHWCAYPTDVMKRPKVHCSRTWTDGWCDDNLETKGLFLEVIGSSVSKTKIEQSISIGVPHRIPVNVTKSQKINVKTDTAYDFKTRTVYENDKSFVEVLAGADFCAKSQTASFVEAMIEIEGVSSPVMVTYRVSCTCQCSAQILEDSGFCNHHGNFSCGVCSCKDKWYGDDCSKYCEERGDQSDNSCIHDYKQDVKCSGNGFCGHCQQCECFTEGDGSQYYLPENRCLDICTQINFDYELCLKETKFGTCYNHSNSYPMNILPCNDTSLKEKDYKGRSVWILCSETDSSGVKVEYYASRTSNEFYMMIGACGGIKGEIIVDPASGGVKVSWIVGLVVAAAALAAAGGYMLWRHQVPPPAHTAQLDNFDAEDCTGRNPLYKSPNSFFKNPTYGKL